MHNPVDKMAFLGFIAGIWVGFGGIAASTVAGGKNTLVQITYCCITNETQAFRPTFATSGQFYRSLVSPFFSRSLWYFESPPRDRRKKSEAVLQHFIILFGGELFTGNTMILTIGLWNRAVNRYPGLALSKISSYLQIPLKRALLNLLIVYISNFTGCLLMAYVFSYQTDLFQDEPYRSYVQSIAYTKTRAHPWWVIFLKAIPANTLVCMAVMLGFAARDGAGKVSLCTTLFGYCSSLIALDNGTLVSGDDVRSARFRARRRKYVFRYQWLASRRR